MIAAREVLRRYPALRESWPLKTARIWREQQGYRQHPRRMVSWYREAPDMHTRICVSNLEMPEAPERCRDVFVSLTLFDPVGLRIASRRYKVARNGTLVVQARDLVPTNRSGPVVSGQLQIDFEGPELGSSRAYLQWYNERGITSTHEKYGLTIPAVGGYWTVPNVRHDPGYRTHLAIINLDEQPYTSSVTLKDADGNTCDAGLALAPSGSRFVSLSDLFQDPTSFLAGQPGTLQFGNNRQPAIYYYFIQNEHLGTWRAQHL